jgi:hypothetical protein
MNAKSATATTIPAPVAGLKAVPEAAPRGSLFISHAVEDNDFAIWLGSRLSAAGYDVWADVMRLKGGDDWMRVLEDALRNKATKMLWVATQKGVEKQGVRNEIQMATDVGKKIGDPGFIIPLKLERCEIPFVAVHHQWIDFERGWGAGLAELLENLGSIEGLTKTAGLNADSMARWLTAQGSRNAVLKREPDVLVSNWLPVRLTPATVRYFCFFGAGAEDQASAAVAGYTYPAALHKSGFFAFGNADDFKETPFGIAPTLVEEIPMDDFLAEGSPRHGLQPREAKNMYSVLVREALERWLKKRGLLVFEFSARTRGYWAAKGLFKEKDRVSFDWKNGWKGSRSLTGEVTRGRKKKKDPLSLTDEVPSQKKYNWHYGVSVHVRVEQETQIQLTPRLIFTEDGIHLVDTARKMHALRRSIPRGWRNDRWRDLMLAFLYWLSEGEDTLDISVGTDRLIRIGAMPVTMQAPVSIASPTDKIEGDEIEDEDPVFQAERDEGDAADGEDE